MGCAAYWMPLPALPMGASINEARKWKPRHDDDRSG